jgi:hypothetical protein
MSKFALLVQCHEAVSAPPNETVITKEGQWRLVIDGEWGETSVNTDGPRIIETRTDMKLFPSREAVAKFMKKWKGHPWYCVPNGNYKAIEVEPTYRQVLSGYKEKK